MSAMWEFFNADGYWNCTNGKNDSAVSQARPSYITQAEVCKLCGSKIKRQAKGRKQSAIDVFNNKYTKNSLQKRKIDELITYHLCKD